ncbi:MAG: hypothetical protein ABEH40_04715 [Haloferacaceae archaeon]
MSLDRTDDGRPSADAPPADVPPGDPCLRSVVVPYESGPDRRTVYPAGVADHERLTRWISADDDAFVDLDAVR